MGVITSLLLPYITSTPTTGIPPLRIPTVPTVSGVRCEEYYGCYHFPTAALHHLYTHYWDPSTPDTYSAYSKWCEV